MAEPKEYPESMRIWEEGQKVADNLVKHGEGFSLALGRALNNADPNNSAKIKKAHSLNIGMCLGTLPIGWIAERSDNTIEHLRACAAAGTQGYSVCPGHNGKFYCETDGVDNCRDTCEYCGAPKGMIFRGCEKCKECIENNWNKPDQTGR